MEKAVERKRIVYFDVLNVLACLCVVGMHCNGAVHAFSDSSGCCHFCIHKVCLRLSDFSKREIYPSHQMAFRGKFWNLLDTRAGYRSNYIVVFGRYIKRMVAAIRRVCGLFCRSAACKGIAEDPICRQIFVSIKIYTVRIAELTVRFRPKG